MVDAGSHTADATDPFMGLDRALARGSVRAPTWLPGAVRVVGESAGPHVGGGWKITHHTTEGRTAEGAIAAYRAHRDGRTSPPSGAGPGCG